MIILLALTWISCTNNQESSTVQDSADVSSSMDPEKEKEAILEIIEEETRCFFAKDYDCWQDTYAQKEYASQVWNNDDGTINSKVGWDKIRAATETFIKNNPGPGGTYPKIERRNILYKFFGDDGVYLIYDQYNSDEAQEVFYQSKEVRVLEKINGKWKIVNVSAIWNTKGSIPADSLKNINM